MRTRRDERGQAAGFESIPLGIVLFVSVTLIVVNAWAIVDTRATLGSAARDYLRAYTREPTRAAGITAGSAAAGRSIGERTGEQVVTISHPNEPFGPCRAATVEITVEVRAIRVPFLGGLGTTEVSTTQSELVQPYGTAIDERPDLPTPCDETP